MTTREAYELAYRLVRLDLKHDIDKRTAHALRLLLPDNARWAAWASIPVKDVYYWTSTERRRKFWSLKTKGWFA